MKLHTIPLLLAFGLLAACQKPAKYVEITSSLPNTQVYFNGKYLGDSPVKLDESRLKELGLTYPYDIRSGNQLWDDWDLDVNTGDAIIVQNDPKSKIAGRFKFHLSSSNSEYKTVTKDGQSWLIFQLNFDGIGSFPDHELGRRFTAIPIKAEQDAAANP